MRVSLQALKAFEAAALLGSFKAAAQDLSLTPTAISHHVKNLENQLGVSLFYRQTRLITLTPEGQRLAHATAKGFAVIETALDEIMGDRKTLRVTTTSSLAALMLIPDQHNFSTAHPDLKIEISTGEVVDKQSHTLPIRLGDIRNINPTDILIHEQFNLYGSFATDQLDLTAGPLVIYTTEWKNKNLPALPVTDWLAANNIVRAQIILKTFDQELFGIQQALAHKSFVLCSDTLAKSHLETGLLKSCGTQAVPSDLCYYIPDKDKFTTRAAVKYIQWVEQLLRR